MNYSLGRKFLVGLALDVCLQPSGLLARQEYSSRPMQRLSAEETVAAEWPEQTNGDCLYAAELRS